MIRRFGWDGDTAFPNRLQRDSSAMTKKDLQGFDIRYPVGLGAGLATALLFVSARHQGTAAALLLSAMSPLPLMIATLGFGTWTGLGAAIAATVTIMTLLISVSAALSLQALLTAALGGLVFASTLALPSWWLAWLAASGRAQVILPFLRSRLTGFAGLGTTKESLEQKTPAQKTQDARPPVYPVGDILMSAAAITFVIVTASTLMIVFRHGSYEAALVGLVTKVKPLIVEMLGSRELPKNLDVTLLSRLIVVTMPATASSLVVLMFLANLWLGGRVVQVSNRLPHAWPDLPRNLRAPRLSAILFFACLGLAFLHGPGGLVASIAAASLALIFALQGLAVIHDLSRGMKFRTALLGGLYFALGLLMPWPLIIFLVIGLIEAGFSLRDRKAAGA